MKKISIILAIIIFPLLALAQLDSIKAKSKIEEYKYCVSKMQVNKQYESDSNYLLIHDNLYQLVISILDSVFVTVKDDRVASIYYFLRLRIRQSYPFQADTLGFWGIINQNPEIVDTSLISFCPLLETESLAIGLSSDSVCGYYSPRQRLIVVYFPLKIDALCFLLLAQTIYHEGYHAWLHYCGQRYATKEEEHKLIRDLDENIFDVLLPQFLKTMGSIEQ